MSTSTNKLIIQTYTLIIGILLLLTKFMAYVLSNSNAILTDALESVVNILAGAFGLYSLFIAAKPIDEDHPYGHGKIELISATIEGTLVLTAGLIMILKSIYNLIYPVELKYLDFGMILIATTGVINYILGWYSKKVGTKYSSATLISSGVHLKTDAYSTFAIIIGLGFIYFTALNWLDNLLSIAAGLFILHSGFKIILSSADGIMDRADFILLDKTVAALNKNRKKEWIDIHNLRIVKYGENVHIDCHTTIPWYWNTQDMHNELKLVELAVKDAIPNHLETFIHADPCTSNCCSICLIDDCTVRQKPFKQKIEWTILNIIKNEKHNKTLIS